MQKIVLILFFLLLLQACQTRIPSIDQKQSLDSIISDVEEEQSVIKDYKELSIFICDRGLKTADELVSFFMSSNPDADETKVLRLANFYVSEALEEGVNSDAAFVQMCLETGFLRFGGLVSEEMNNFCGLGAMSETQRGLAFESEQLGVRAHIQHLHAYGCTDSLKNDLVDPRYKYVNPRGKAPTIFELAGTWASDKQYGYKLNDLLIRLSYF